MRVDVSLSFVRELSIFGETSQRTEALQTFAKYNDWSGAQHRKGRGYSMHLIVEAQNQP